MESVSHSERSKDGAIVTLDDEEGVRQIVTDTLFGPWSTVNNLSRLRQSRHERYRVTVFGSARPQAGHWVYEEVRRMSAGLTALGCDIVTGGGPGLMEAANRGASEGDAASETGSIGIRVHLPFEQHVNPFVEQAFEHGTFSRGFTSSCSCRMPISSLRAESGRCSKPR